MALSACTQVPWNDPYPAADAEKNILYDSFSERPKHLDPVRAYSANEYVFIAQIYEPPLQYHFLIRPYQLVPLTATTMPRPVYLDSTGRHLPDGAPLDEIAYTLYRITIQPGIAYQPHPAFAKSDDGAFLYHHLTASDLKGVHTLVDFQHTGTRELVADDYVYQIKRIAHPELHSPIAGLMSKYIVGLSELSETLRHAYDKLARDPEQSVYLDLSDYPLEGVKAIDRYTYEVKIEGTYPQFTYWLAMPFFAPMPWEADKFYTQPGMAARNITLDWYPVGTGPYMLGENNPNRRMVLVMNPSFRGELYPAQGEPGDEAQGVLVDAGKPMPFIDRAVYSLEKETIPYWNKFLQGYYDTSGISSDNFDQAIQFNTHGEAQLTEAMVENGIQLQTAVTTSSFYMGFNMRDDVVGGDSERARKLRQAISIAVDYEELISIFSNGRGIAAQGPIPPGIFGYREGEAGINAYVYDWVNGKPRRKSIGEARRLLAEAGYPGGRDSKTGKPLILYFDSLDRGPDTKAYLDWLRKQFNKLNIQLVIRSTDYNRFQEKMLDGTAQIFQWGWNADYPDPENFLFLLYGPNAKVGKGGENASNYEIPEFDRLFEKMKDMDNGPERQAIIDEMVDIARRDAPWLWGFHPVAFSLYQSWYSNAKPNLMANNVLKYKRVDPVLRAKLREAWNQLVIWPVVLLIVVLVASVIPAFVTFRRKEKAAAL
ncbi:MAG: ABC transporter substrate-binding protein [Gammaproteobacteria bacterium]|nr:ABC transporter substrate-binding protein [Gammaproteobacteria bacterium]MCI0591028.1 ABC transporter substrate-binding protein [Gammaproteobacteria bacterium]